MVEVPEGVVAGQQLQVTAPNGQVITVPVPEGVVAGQQLQVEVPGGAEAAVVGGAALKAAVRLVGASSLDRAGGGSGGGGGGAAAVGEGPALLQGSELQAESAALRALLAEQKGEVTVEVVSAKALTKTQSAALAKTLTARVGKDVKISAAVDESLIGGLVVKMGSKMIDTSILSKLNSLQNAMKEVG